MNIEKTLQTAESLRLAGDLQSAYNLLIPLTETKTDNSFVQLEMGLTLDAMGKEEEAIPYYEKALSLGLPAEQRCVALLCVGSSYRNVGQAEIAQCILRDAIEEFPEHIGLRCFYALALYSAGEVGQSARTLMEAILLVSPETVEPFTRALLHYSKELK